MTKSPQENREKELGDLIKNLEIAIDLEKAKEKALAGLENVKEYYRLKEKLGIYEI